MTRIATKEEVVALYAALAQPLKIQSAQGGGAVTASYGNGESIVIRRSPPVPIRRSVHSNR